MDLCGGEETELNPRKGSELVFVRVNSWIKNHSLTPRLRH